MGQSIKLVSIISSDAKPLDDVMFKLLIRDKDWLDYITQSTDEMPKYEQARHTRAVNS